MSRKSRRQENKRWVRQYLNRQRAINAYARCRLCPKKRTDVFTVYHPEEYRRFLRQGPCPQCPVQGCCDRPCQVYLDWYDGRMELYRQLMNGEG